MFVWVFLLIYIASWRYKGLNDRVINIRHPKGAIRTILVTTFAAIGKCNLVK